MTVAAYRKCFGGNINKSGLTLSRSSSAWVPDRRWTGREARRSGPAPGGARCCTAAEPRRRGWGLSGAAEGPPRRCSGVRSAPPGETRPRNPEGRAPRPETRAEGVPLIRQEGRVGPRSGEVSPALQSAPPSRTSAR